MYAPKGLTSELLHAKIFNNTKLMIEKITLEDIYLIVENFKNFGGKQNAVYNFIGDSGIAIGNKFSGGDGCWEIFDTVINCGALPHFEHTSDPPQGKTYYFLPIPEGKKGQSHFFAQIPYATSLNLKGKTLIHCMQGRDRSVGIALAIFLARIKSNNQMIYDKKIIEDTLLWIQSFHPLALPSRATIKKLHLYFISNYNKPS